MVRSKAFNNYLLVPIQRLKTEVAVTVTADSEGAGQGRGRGGLPIALHLQAFDLIKDMQN